MSRPCRYLILIGNNSRMQRIQSQENGKILRMKILPCSMPFQLLVSIEKRGISPVHRNAAQRALTALPLLLFFACR
jgi:hypothetical protein